MARIAIGILCLVASISMAHAAPYERAGDFYERAGPAQHHHAKPRHARRHVEFIPHPRGCPRRNFCACGLAKFWSLGPGLDAVRTWVRRYIRAHAPGPGIAAVRRDQHHIIGIVGGQPGAWEVVDFNSGGHKSRRYIRTSFEGYFFIAPRG